MAALQITKADGQLEAFDPAKLEHSLAHAGASSTMRARILSHVISELHPGIMTEEIYHHAYRMLRDNEDKPVLRGTR